MRHWYRGVAGAALLAQERSYIEAVLSDLFGYHLVQIGRCSEDILYASSRIKHRVMVVDHREEVSGRDDSDYIQASTGYLPLSSDSVDVVLLPHTLEFAASPHQILREVERILIPEGCVIILGFNPWSLWGVTRLLLGWRGQVPWCGHFYSAGRIRDWLALLGFDSDVVHYHAYRPPLGHAEIIRRLAILERICQRFSAPIGGGYVVVGRKRQMTLTPIKPRWRPRRRLLGGLVEPTARRDEV